mmetsp:Transcript_82068/g.183077  ORF Transcript_82068/g.183077 Transcript_82068/m.183077 type:complete len:583 (+) Transcript_82068:62-1810(+)
MALSRARQGSAVQPSSSSGGALQTGRSDTLGLSLDEKQSLVAMTEEMPLCPGFGLWNVFEELWECHKGRLLGFEFNCKWILYLICQARIWLSAFTAWSGCMRFWYGHDDLYNLGLGHAGSYIMHTEHRTELCDYDHHGSVEASCLELSLSRWNIAGAILTMECAINMSMALITFVPSMAFLCGWRSGSRRELPEACPFLFFFVPGFAYKFSSLSGLQFVNLKRAESLFVRHEGEFWCEIVLQPFSSRRVGNRGSTAGFDMLPQQDQGGMPMPRSSGRTYWQEIKEMDHERKAEGRPCVNIRRIIAWTFSALCFSYSFQALLVKLTMMHFITVHSFHYWSIHEWLLIVGFINTVSGAFDADLIEMHRTLLLKFGGEDASWNSEEIMHVVDYFNVLSKRILADFLGPRGNGFCARSRVLAAMALWNCQDLQRQLLCNKRAAQLRRSRQSRLELYQELFDSKSAKEFADAMGADPGPQEEMPVALSAEKMELLRFQWEQALLRLSEWESVQQRLSAEAAMPAATVAPGDPREPTWTGILQAEVETHIMEIAEVLAELKERLPSAPWHFPEPRNLKSRSVFAPLCL